MGFIFELVNKLVHRRDNNTCFSFWGLCHLNNLEVGFDFDVQILRSELLDDLRFGFHYVRECRIPRLVQPQIRAARDQEGGVLVGKDRTHKHHQKLYKRNARKNTFTDS